MARRSVAVGARTNDDGPPPSTLAAQLVHNQNRRTTNQPSVERTTFKDILHELLHNEAVVQETNVNVNAQLVGLVAEAGLLPLTPENPFLNHEALLTQAFDSIAVIEKTVKRQPETLLVSGKPNCPQTVLGLVATLFLVAGRPKCDCLPIAKLLNTILKTISGSVDLWQHAHALQCLIRESIDDIYTALEALPAASDTISVSVPPARVIPQFWPDSGSAILVPAGTQGQLYDPVQAFIAALQIYQSGKSSHPWIREATQRAVRLSIVLRPRLEKARVWELCIDKLLPSESSLPLVEYLLNDLLKSRSSINVQKKIAREMLNHLRRETPYLRDSLFPAVEKLGRVPSFAELDQDLKITITTLLCRFDDGHGLPEDVLKMRDALHRDDLMSDSELISHFRQLSVQNAKPDDSARKRKRKMFKFDCRDVRVKAVQRTTKLFTGVETEDLAALPDVASSAYARLDEVAKCAVWQSLADLAEHDVLIAAQTVTCLLGMPEMNQTPKSPRVLSLHAIRACINHAAKPQYLELVVSHMKLGTTAMGKHCLASLHSSNRELRITAGDTLPCFLQPQLQENIRKGNLQVALQYLRNLSGRNAASELETLIPAWGWVALACSGEEMNLVLLQLVEFLGHSNSLISALAFAEIEKTAASKGHTVENLFKPFWRSIAISVVGDLHVKPQKIQQLCELLGINVNQFLLLTQRETLPFLVLTKRTDILQRIANARGSGRTVEELLLEPRTNLVAVLGFLLIQPSSDVEESAMSCLAEVAPLFKRTETGLSTLVKTDPVLIACEMLNLCGEESEKRKSRAYQGFHTFASLAGRERNSGSRKANIKSSKDTDAFFDSSILGILTQYSINIAASVSFQSTSDKIRCLKGISEMFVLTRGNVSGALPQIKGCLQSGLGQPELCETAFRAWLSMLAVLPSDDIASVIDETFALVVRYWPSFSAELQSQTHDAIKLLVRAHQTVLRENIMSLPSLAGIPLLSKIASEFNKLKDQEIVEPYFEAFAQRMRSDSSAVVLQAISELVPFLEKHQESIHDAAASDTPASALASLIRALLDATVKFSGTDGETAEHCGKALGIIGSLDPNRIEVSRKKRRVLLLSNFERASEAIDWVLTLLEDVLVKVFNSATNARTQGFLAHAIQELLRFCKVNDSMPRSRASQSSDISQRWDELPEDVRITLTPFLTSSYRVTSNNPISAPKRVYPSFSTDTRHDQWLGSVTYDLMFRARGGNPQTLFPLLARMIRGHGIFQAKHMIGDLSIARFIFPYAVLNVVLEGTVSEVKDLSSEFLAVLKAVSTTPAQQETVRLCSESIFDLLDYLSTWLMEKKRRLALSRMEAYKTGQSTNEFDEAKDMGQIESVEQFLTSIPAETVANSALECRSFARALFHWEQFVRTKRSLVPSGPISGDDEDLYGRLLDIYSQIDEPDGLEGVSAHLTFISEQQRAINHEKAGRWTAAQAWYELQLSDDPGHLALQHELLRCLRETGRHAPLLRYVDGFVEQCANQADQTLVAERHLPLATEACWMTDDFAGLRRRLKIASSYAGRDFNIGVGSILVHAQDRATEAASEEISRLRRSITEGLSVGGTDSLQACHQELFKLHVLYELEALSTVTATDAPKLAPAFDKRLASIGSYIQDKQFILGVRRAILKLRPEVFDVEQSGKLWLTTARLARQTRNNEIAYTAVLKATECRERAANIEEAKLLWHDGHQRQAIQSVESAINSGLFDGEETDVDTRTTSATVSTTSTDSSSVKKQNTLRGKAVLLLAKWIDASGQSQTKDMTLRYQVAARGLQRAERGHYYLSKHYSKLLDAQKALPREKRSDAFFSGEHIKVIVDNGLRSVPFGSKYWHETIPRVLTLWMELGTDALHKSAKDTLDMFDKRQKALQSTNRQVQKYFERVPAYVFYHALPQLISRITHPNPDVWKQLSSILTRIAATHPSQVLWSLFAVVKANDALRVSRGNEILNRLKDPKLRLKADGSDLDVRIMITNGQKLAENLLQACEEPVETKASYVSLMKNLKFNHKLAPSQLVVPVEATLHARSPPVGANTDQIKRFKAFTQDRITIQAFDDNVLVLSSLQRPRKITVRGSNGKVYGLLCKPKDDLRKDQRLMEFNGIINRALKRNTESSKRRLYIKTYAVTPLSEESGTIEWVEGIKPIRDILLGLYQRKGIRPNYNDIRKKLDEASLRAANAHIFTTLTKDQFPPILHEWFTETYPEPETWFAARLRYARSAAVMSMTGHMLGLGDRHGENILLEESTGGVFHVDFNCLFDKGLTFEKPEMVPFRLTHNMVDAMGAYGYEGPFRKSCELTLGLLRQERDTLMTVLETFLYDPTTDFVGRKKRATSGMPETPSEILESVATKLRGLLKGETVPLSVEGYVDALIQQATDPFALAQMYIGWCSFL